VRILVDYRPALRERTGVGEYVHQLAGAYRAATDDEVVLFSSSWKDRLSSTVAAELGVNTVDCRVPVALLNYLWHRLQWPPVEMLAGRADVVHAAHPLLIPARHAAQVVTIHDLFFLAHPERTRAEIRRDYPAFTAIHARRADAVITSTEYGRRLITERLGVGAERVYVCPAGAPAWRSLGRQPHRAPDGYILFLGTLEPRKNIGALLDAYSLLLDRQGAPRLVLAGRATPDAKDWLARITRPPLAGHVAYLGYVPTEEREGVYAGARVVVIPSLDEGFGLPALEAMSAGIPVVASNRGSLPEVLGDAGILVEPSDVHALAHALERVLTDDRWAAARATAGLARAGMFTWARAAATLHRAYTEAVGRRRARSRLGISDS
jgi:glycosyltransferase involved in cell wall biosynthesis